MESGNTMLIGGFSTSATSESGIMAGIVASIATFEPVLEV
jgi:hypothetical protein